MAKQGMKRPEWTHTQPKNTAAAVPEIQGKAKHGKTHANPIIAGTEAPNLSRRRSRFPMLMRLLTMTLQGIMWRMT